MTRFFCFAALAFLMNALDLQAQVAPPVQATSFKEGLNTGWSKEQSTLPGRTAAYRRFDPWGNQCGVSLWADGSGVTLRAFDVNLPTGKVLHSIDVRKNGNKVTRTDTWYDSTATKEIPPAGDLFLEDCEWMLPSLPSEIRPLLHETYTPRAFNPRTTKTWTKLKPDDKRFSMERFTAMYENGICRVGLMKDGKTLLVAEDSLHHGRVMAQTVLSFRDSTYGEMPPMKLWRLESPVDSAGNGAGQGEATLFSGPDLFLTYCTPVVKYLPEAVVLRIPKRWQFQF